jgi:hypothetical protein
MPGRRLKLAVQRFVKQDMPAETIEQEKKRVGQAWRGRV